MELQSLGKWLIGAGTFIVVIGALLHFFGRIPYIGRLPGDIMIKRDHFTFYFPLTTCILFSLVLMLIARLFGHK